MARNEAAFGRKLTSDPGQVCGQDDPRPEIYISDDVPAKGIA
jgi:hypothetical protein